MSSRLQPDTGSLAETIAKKYFPCTCGEMYLSRKLTAHDCPYHANDWESAMVEYASHHSHQPVVQDLSQDRIDYYENKIESLNRTLSGCVDIDLLLSEFKRQGFDTTNWDGEEGVEKAIVDGVKNHYVQPVVPVQEQPFYIDGKTTVTEIDEMLREYYTKNKDDKGSGFGMRVIQQIVKQVSDSQRHLFKQKDTPAAPVSEPQECYVWVKASERTPDKKPDNYKPDEILSCRFKNHKGVKVPFTATFDKGVFYFDALSPKSKDEFENIEWLSRQLIAVPAVPNECPHCNISPLMCKCCGEEI